MVKYNPLCGSPQLIGGETPPFFAHTGIGPSQTASGGTEIWMTFTGTLSNEDPNDTDDVSVIYSSHITCQQ